jgi:hypothetical protein
VSIACCVFAIVWLFFDPLAPRTVATYFDLPTSVPGVELGAPSSHLLIIRALTALAIVGLVLIALGLYLGPPAHRGVRSWLAITALLAFWLGLAVSWRSLAVAGQEWRLTRQLDSFEPLAEQLRHSWPRGDDYWPELGHFTAYPIGRPRMLLVISNERLADHTPFYVVERSDAGALRFELAREEAGAWLEWHPPGSQPATFTGGLEDERRLTNVAALNDGWYLTHYGATLDAAAAASTPAK